MYSKLKNNQNIPHNNIEKFINIALLFTTTNLDQQPKNYYTNKCSRIVLSRDPEYNTPLYTNNEVTLLA